MDENPTPTTPFLKLSNSAYDVLIWIAQILLPAIVVLYLALAQFWTLPEVQGVVGTITAADVFLGALLKYASRAYNNSDAKYDGEMTATSDPSQPHALSFNVPLAELAKQNQIVLKVVPKA